MLLARKLWRLVRDYRAHVPGSRLTARTVGIFGALVIAPLLIVYLSSLEFINRGIDSWFKVEVKQGLNDALGLSRAALDLRMREYSARTEALAPTRWPTPPPPTCRRGSMPSGAPRQALEIVLFGAARAASSRRASRIRSRRCPRSRRRTWCARWSSTCRT